MSSVPPIVRIIEVKKVIVSADVPKEVVYHVVSRRRHCVTLLAIYHQLKVTHLLQRESLFQNNEGRFLMIYAIASRFNDIQSNIVSGSIGKIHDQPIDMIFRLGQNGHVCRTAVLQKRNVPQRSKGDSAISRGNILGESTINL